MSDRLLKESDVLRIAFQLPLVVNSAFADAVKALPSADRPQGEWIDYIGYDLGIEGQWLRDDGKTVFVQCDQCDSIIVRNLMTHMNFCPYCGARMKGEADE